MAGLGWMRSDPSLRIASLILAVLIWMYVRGEEKPVQVFSVPLEIEGIPGNLAIGGETPDIIAVRVRAPEATLKNLSPGRFQARIRLSDAKPGDLTIPLASSDVRAPIGVEVLQVEPRNVTLRLERRMTREVPIGVRVKGNAAAGFEYAGYTVAPEKVRVEGPEGAVSQVREALAEEVDITGRSLNFEMPVSLTPDKGNVRILEGTGVVVRVAIRPARVTRLFTGVRLEPGFPTGVKHPVRLQPPTVTVELKAPREVLDRLDPSAIRAFLDLEGMNPRSAPYLVKPRIVIEPADLAAQVAINSVSDETIHVRIDR